MSISERLTSLKSRPDDETTYTPKAPGSFQRGACRVQNWIGDSPFDLNLDPSKNDKNRYHLFINYGCGWCHQVLQVRMLRGLKDIIGVTHVGLKRGNPQSRGTPDYLGYVIHVGEDNSGYGYSCIRDVYNAGPMVKPDKDSVNNGNFYGTNQLTIPVLFDKRTKKIVSNDPAQILLMINEFAVELGGKNTDRQDDLYPECLRDEIEKVNSVIFPGINNGVYCCWFGQGECFDEGYNLVQNGLNWVEERLEKQSKENNSTFLVGSGTTLADIRAFPHLIRFDIMYYELMLRNKGSRVFETIDGNLKFPYLTTWLRNMFSYMQDTCDLVVATRFYLNDGAKDMTTEKCDAEYDRAVGVIHESCKGETWLPTREEWAEKRKGEGIKEEWVIVPPVEK